MSYRAHEVAKKLKISMSALKARLLDKGIIIKSHMSPIDDEIVKTLVNENVLNNTKTNITTKDSVEMDKLLENFIIFIDTCSLMHEGSSKVFNGIFFNILNIKKKKVILLEI